MEKGSGRRQRPGGRLPDRPSPREPTHGAATARTPCPQVARVGGFFAPVLLLGGRACMPTGCALDALPYAVWSLLGVAAGASALWLPETSGELSLESVADLHALVGRARAGNPYALVRGSDEETCLPVV